MSDPDAVVDRVVTIPNVLSLLRLALVPVFCWLVVAGHDGWAIAVLMASGVSDYLDGTLARRWGQVSRIGQLLDPAVDRLSIVSTVIVFAVRGVIPWWFVVLLVSRDVLLGFTVPLLARRGYGPLPVHFLGKTATFGLLCAFPLLLLAELVGPASTVIRSVAWAFVWWGGALYWWAAWLYGRQLLSVLREVPKATPD